jgi:hypothetical protein
MKTKIILFLSLFMLTLAAQSQKTQKTTTTTEPIKYRVIVSFASKGSGIDATTVAKFESYLITYGKKVKQTITYDKVSWGKGGEVDYCFVLKELSKSKQDDFVKGLQNVIKGSANTSVTENAVCTHKK